MSRESGGREPASNQSDWQQQALEPGFLAHQSDRPQAEPICLSSVWQMDSPDQADHALGGQNDRFVYRREGSPNDRSLSSKLAKLYGAEHGILTSQGMSAIATVALSVLRPRARVAIANELYGTSTKLMRKFLANWQVETLQFDPSNPSDVDGLAQTECGMILVETISNPMVRVPDIKRLSQAANSSGAVLVVDNTFATCASCRPLELGAAVVVESLGKSVNGHSDGMLGWIATDDEELHASFAETVRTLGMASSPMDCYLTHRGLMTLAVRLERCCQNAMALAEALSELSAVESVSYPGLKNHPDHELAQTQLRNGFGWMLSFRLACDRSEVTEFFRRLEPEVAFVPSLGDVATSVSHPASTSHRGYSQERRAELGIDEGTVRVSCGLESTEWLIEHFTRAITSS